MTPTTAARLDEYRARKAHRAAVRAELAERRRHGLVQRHAQKLRHIAAQAEQDGPRS